jgi:hypothetical protein
MDPLKVFVSLPALLNPIGAIPLVLVLSLAEPGGEAPHGRRLLRLVSAVQGIGAPGARRDATASFARAESS